MISTISISFILVLNTLLWQTTSSENNEKLLIYLNNGAVRGKEDIDENGNIFYTFAGIPFAESPIGHLRFQPPVPKSPWNSILDATKDGPSCPQLDFLSKKFKGNEDNCLTLNVYIPKIPLKNDRKKLDVLFFIHGGGFAFDNGGEAEYGPKRLMQEKKNIIIVSTNYRLSVLGFLSTDDSSAWGNYGLLDQVEALRWVRNNIDRFGGDPDRVTIFGQSAGGISVMYQLLSPLTKGLFHRAIVMSGSALSTWALQQEPLYIAKSLAKNVGCPVEETNSLVQCLRQKDAKQLIENDMSNENGMFSVVFNPTVDNHFILDTPYRIITQKQYKVVPSIMGVTKNEGNMWFKVMRKSQDDFTEKDVEECIATLFATLAHKDEVVQLVKNKYFPNYNTLSQDEINQRLSQIITDGGFHQFFYLAIITMSATGTPIYAYSYDYNEKNKLIAEVFNITELGAGHSSDLDMFFSGAAYGEPKEGTALEVQKEYQNLFVNFATTGVPRSKGEEPPWAVSKPDEIKIYHIDSVESVTVHDPNKDDMFKFWTDDVPAAMAKDKLSKYDQM